AHVLVVPAFGGRGRRMGGGAVDLHRLAGSGCGVTGQVACAGDGGGVLALARYRAVGRAGAGDAGERIAARPVDGHVAVVPARGVRGRCGRAAEGGRGLVYVDAGEVDVSGVARRVHRVPRGGLVAALAQRLDVGAVV